MFQLQNLQFYARKEVAVLPLTGVFNVERPAAYPLDNKSVLYILPKQFPIITQTPLQRHAQRVTQRLKVFGQFRLTKQADRADELILPQPSLKTWQPYQPAFALPPKPNTQSDEAPYWQIETLEFKVLRQIFMVLRLIVAVHCPHSLPPFATSRACSTLL